MIEIFFIVSSEPIGDSMMFIKHRGNPIESKPVDIEFIHEVSNIGDQIAQSFVLRVIV
jgi:hypothetical protein